MEDLGRVGFFYNFIYSFILGCPGLCCCAWAFWAALHCSHRLLIAMLSLVAEHGLWGALGPQELWVMGSRAQIQ